MRGRGGFVAGLMIGFVLGSLSSTLFGSVVTSQTTIIPCAGKEEEGSAPASLATSDQSIVGNATISYHPPASVSAVPPPPSSSSFSFLEEIMPESLRELYRTDRLTFPVTRSMLRRSRPIVGNTQRMRTYLNKLRAGRCTTVLFMGGSVTRGHGAGGHRGAYPKLFVDWLNACYPCTEAAATVDAKNESMAAASNRHVAKLTNAQNSQTHFTIWSHVADMSGGIDLVLMEFNVNDEFIPDLPHILVDNEGPACPTRWGRPCWRA